MSKQLEEAVNKVFNDLVEKKNELIQEKLKSLKIDVDMEAEAKSRFKSFSAQESEDGVETIYYNDGSVDGIEVFKSIIQAIPFDPKSEDVKVSLKLVIL